MKSFRYRTKDQKKNSRQDCVGVCTLYLKKEGDTLRAQLLEVSLLLVLLILSCNEKSFDDELNREPNVGTGDSEIEVVAEDMPFIEIKPHELFVLNPVNTERSVEEINLSKTDTVKKTIVMESEKQSQQQAMRAKSRSWHNKQIEQTGSNGTTRTETFTRSKHKGLLDLLLVIDDSGSMITVHGYLQDRLSNLLQHISNSNWKINIIDVDGRSICARTIVTKNNQSIYETTLADLKAKANSNPNTHERTLQKAKHALGISGNCDTWLRPNSTLAVVIITDEDHQCTNSSAPDNRGDDNNSFRCGTQVGQFITAFRALRLNTGLYGIFEDQVTCADARANSYDYRECFLRDSTNAGSELCLFTNPCYGRNDSYKLASANYLTNPSRFDRLSYVRGSASDYETILKNISSGIKAKLQDQFTLTAEPDNKGIEVKVNNKKTNNYQINGKILSLTKKGNNNDTIKITYTPKVGIKPFIKTLSVESQADMSTLEVRVAGNKLNKPTHYTISGNTITIKDVETNFPSGSIAYLKWQKQTIHDPKQKEFRFGGTREIIPKSVSIAGYVASRYTFHTNPNRVIFNTGQEPNYGAEFNIRYEYYYRGKLTYKHNYSGAYPITAVNCSLPCRHNGDNIVFNRRDFQRGKSISINLSVQGLKSDRRPVPQHYIADSLELELNGNKCTEKELVISSGEIMLKTADAQDNGCTMLADLDNNLDQDMAFSYLAFTPKQEIEVGLENLLEHVGYGVERWEVYVAGQKKEEGKDYTVSGRKITFKGNYPPDTQGEVRIFIRY